MSLKEESKEIFRTYGLNEEEINVLLAYLGNTQSTASFIASYLEMNYELVKTITDKLVTENFLKEIKSDVKVSRYIPLEPYFQLTVEESKKFRGKIEKVKDAVLEDQSKRFDNLESIRVKSVGEIDQRVEEQVETFFRDSDEHDSDKRMAIEKAKDRFTTTARDTYAKLEQDIREVEAKAAAIWDNHSAKFTGDNQSLNSKLDTISDEHVSKTSVLETDLHTIVDTLNGQLKGIADGFVSNFEGGITTAKGGINTIIADLLKDFAERVSKLDTEIKKQLDSHVDYHKEHAEALKPSLDEILAKYMARMYDVIEELKRTITKLLYEQADHIKSTTDGLQNLLIQNVSGFEENTLMLIDNLADISSKLSGLSHDLAKRGSAFKALFIGKHKEWKALNEEVKERVGKLSTSVKEGFTASTGEYTEKNQSILTEENNKLKAETEELDKKAQDSVNVEMEGLAADLSAEIDATFAKNIDHCKDTTIKLKDLTQSTLENHHTEYDAAISRHLKISLGHYEDSDREVKHKVNEWYSEMDSNHVVAKNKISAETAQQITDVKTHLTATKDKNVEHSKTFENDKNQLKETQNQKYNGSLSRSEKYINDEITLFQNETKEMNDKLHAMLEDHKSKYQENATFLQQSLTRTINENIQNTKDAIADFTLQFMNGIDEATEIALSNEDKLSNILEASASIIEVPEASTWHIVGMPGIVEAVNDMLGRVKSSIIVVTHQVVPKIMETMSQMAYRRKAARFFYTTHWTPEFETILARMKALGNIQFRQMKTAGNFIAVTKDAEEVILAPYSTKEEEIIAVVSTQEGFATLYSQIIGPVFQANSRPI
ncbi:MAG: hypothetical protein EU530_04625 [Promethearchaeota archaeon]|nr:MAG: hypothetical protein EU530_04625 [Candidatus Lokiarchaeota archaeon]